jgi:hypothetical protein
VTIVVDVSTRVDPDRKAGARPELSFPVRLRVQFDLRVEISATIGHGHGTNSICRRRGSEPDPARNATGVRGEQTRLAQ